MTARRSAEPWTAERIRAYGARMPGVDAIDAVFGCGPNRAYELLRTGAVDLPVIRCGHRYWVPTAAVLAALLIDDRDGVTAGGGEIPVRQGHIDAGQSHRTTSAVTCDGRRLRVVSDRARAS